MKHAIRIKTLAVNMREPQILSNASAWVNLINMTFYTIGFFFGQLSERVGADTNKHKKQKPYRPFIQEFKKIRLDER
ncbi:MAG: hypothetical protein ABJN36_08425 [Cyclobacteriaceae bacterium]